MRTRELVQGRSHAGTFAGYLPRDGTRVDYHTSVVRFVQLGLLMRTNVRTCLVFEVFAGHSKLTHSFLQLIPHGASRRRLGGQANSTSS